MDRAGSSWAGYVLTGGKSSRMGRDKAMLPWQGTRLALHIGREVEQAVGNVTLVGVIGAKELWPQAIPDAIAEIGPLGGLITALRHTTADWNLIVACDLPHVDRELVGKIRAAAGEDADCVACRTEQGWEPLCAAYHRSVLPIAEEFAAGGRYKMQEFLRALRVTAVAADPFVLHNVNTPEDWAAA